MSRITAPRLWIALSFLVLAATIVVAQDAQSSAPTGGAEQQVRAAMQQMLDASIRGDKDAVSTVVADNVTWINTNGQIAGKDQLLSMLPAPVHAIDIEKVQPLGKTAIATGVAHLKDGMDVRFLQEWVNADGQWKLQAHQGSPIASPAPTPSGNEAMGTTGTSGTMGTMAKNEPHESASRSPEPTLRSADERAIWKVQKDLQHAFLKGDRAAYSKYTADNYVRITPEAVQGKSDFLQIVEKNRNQSAGHLNDDDVQISVDGDTARVVEITSGQLPGGEAIPRTRFTRIFEKKNGQWQQVAAIFTPIKEQ